MNDATPLRLAPDPSPPASEPLLVDARRLAVLLGLGLRTIRMMDAGGKLPRPLKLGGRTLWHLDEVRAWVEAGAPNRESWEARKRVASGRK